MLCAVLLLAGCGAALQSTKDATPQEAAAAAYVHDGPPAITLYTMISNRTGVGAHTSMMINASQRVIFDPAGSVELSIMPEIGDVLDRIENWWENGGYKADRQHCLNRLLWETKRTK